MTRALVAFSSKHGGTAEIAETIAAALRDRGIEADARPATDAGDLGGVDAVILGSAVYMDRWQPDALDLLKRLERMERTGPPVWLFSSGPTAGSPDSEAKLQAILARQPDAPGEAGKRAARLGVRGHATFGGAVSDRMTGFFERWMPRGDWRDMDAVRRWATGIATELHPGGGAPAG